MNKETKEIEIPFGANDSELCGWEYTIPEGMEATIVDNKIVVKKKENEDERIKKAIIEGLREMKNSFHTISSVKIDDAITWLEKQHSPEVNGAEMKEILRTEYEKGRADAIAEMQNAWSEEEVEIIDWLVVSFDCLKIPTDTFYQSKVRPFLVSLRNKIQPIIKEWSEEDEVCRKNLLYYCEYYAILTSEREKCIDWLKDLKERFTLQPHWKLSDEQMKILNEVLNFAANHESPYWNDYIFGTLNNLRRQLKKLRKE